MNKPCLVLLLLGFAFSPTFANSDSRPDSSGYKTLITADLLPFYYNFFDAKIQYRLGAGYSRNNHAAWFIAHYTDFGIYDKYTFTKYYNLFNENNGLYYVENKVFIAGIHYVPSFNFYLIRTKPGSINSIFSGIAMDFSLYHKQHTHFNSSTGLETESHYRQFRVGAGVQMGSRYRLSKRFFTEMRMSFFTNVMNYRNDDESTPIRSLHALWTRNDYKLWLTANICVGYVID
mgnify:CR=1 FL=1